MSNLFNMDNPFFRALGKLADLMILNFLFILCSLPIFTIGASLTALNYVTLKMAENEEGYIARSFFKSFKENFKQATAIWLMALAVGIILVLDVLILRNSSGTLVNVIRIVVTITIFIYLMVLLYVFPVLARFVNTVKNTIRNAFIMAIADFPRTLLMLAIPVAAVFIPAFLSEYIFSYAILAWILFGFSLISFATSQFMKKIFKKYMPKDEEAEEENPDNWVLDETPDGASAEVPAEEAAEAIDAAACAENMIEDTQKASGENDDTDAQKASGEDTNEDVPEASDEEADAPSSVPEE